MPTNVPNMLVCGEVTLLAPYLDAAFDRGFLTVADDGRVIVSTSLDDQARGTLGITPAAPCAGAARRPLRVPTVAPG